MPITNLATIFAAVLVTSDHSAATAHTVASANDEIAVVRYMLQQKTALFDCNLLQQQQQPTLSDGVTCQLADADVGTTQQVTQSVGCVTTSCIASLRAGCTKLS